jgi:DNA-binding NarL/FixJ family response regulator
MTTKTISAALKVVTVEDCSLIVGRVVSLLGEINGVEFVDNAKTIAGALDLIKRTRPDVVILDINLSTQDGKNGINLLNIIRKIYPEMKIIMLTNFADMHYRLLCKEYGADYFLDKSNDFDKIPETLIEIIGAKSLA